jgi:hypothetical protein
VRVCVWRMLVCVCGGGVQLDSHAAAMRDKLDLDKERTVRTPAEMAQEAEQLRALFR